MSRRILIVDADEAFATMLRQGLEEMDGTQADVVDTREEALQATAAADYDLVIVDMGLPDSEASLLVRTLRQEHPHLRLMIIPLEGENVPAEVEDIDLQGVLSKPFFLPELPDRIRAALSWPEGEEPAAEPELEATAGPVAEAVAELAAEKAAPPTLVAYAQLSRAVHLMSGLAEEVGAEAVLLTQGEELLAYTGWLPDEEIAALAAVISDSWRTSARVARILDKEQLRFEQSIEGAQYLLYSLALTEDLILSVAVAARVPLGMIRHRVKEAAETVRELIAT